MDPKRFVLSVDDDTEFRSHVSELMIIPLFTLKCSIFQNNKFGKKKKSRGGVPTPQDGEDGNSF
jgi:hypothetical protein